MSLSAARIEIRLSAPEIARLADLRARLATPILPSVSTSDVVRAGLRALAAQLDATAAPVCLGLA